MRSRSGASCTTRMRRPGATALEQAMGSPEFGEFERKLLETMLAAQKSVRDNMRTYLETMNVPTREDIARLGELVVGLEEKSDQIADRLDAIEDVVRTRRPRPAELDQIAKRLESIDRSLRSRAGEAAKIDRIAKRIDTIDRAVRSRPVVPAKPAARAARGVAAKPAAAATWMPSRPGPPRSPPPRSQPRRRPAPRMTTRRRPASRTRRTSGRRATAPLEMAQAVLGSADAPVGLTPKELVWRKNKARLYRYVRSEPATHGRRSSWSCRSSTGRTSWTCGRGRASSSSCSARASTSSSSTGARRATRTGRWT